VSHFHQIKCKSHLELPSPPVSGKNIPARISVSNPIHAFHHALLVDLPLVPLYHLRYMVQHGVGAGRLSQPLEAIAAIRLEAVRWQSFCLRPVMLAAAPDCLFTRVQPARGQACEPGCWDGGGRGELHGQPHDAQQCDDASCSHVAAWNVEMDCRPWVLGFLPLCTFRCGREQGLPLVAAPQWLTWIGVQSKQSQEKPLLFELGWDN